MLLQHKISPCFSHGGFFIYYMATLLEKAKGYKVRSNTTKPVTEEMIELALAWAKDEISIPQARKALGAPSGGQIYHFFALTLKAYISNKKKL